MGGLVGGAQFQPKPGTVSNYEKAVTGIAGAEAVPICSLEAAFVAPESCEVLWKRSANRAGVTPVLQNIEFHAAVVLTAA